MVDVSVLTPSLDYGRYIEDAIRSVERQDDLVIQHIIQDGGSKDETRQVLERHGDDVDWESGPDAGQSDALNRAFGRSTGRWVAWLNADEFYLPGGLTALVRHGDRSGADVVYGDNVFVDAAGRMARLVPQHRFSRQVLRLYGAFIPTSSAIYRRDVLPEAPWDLELRMIMDWDLFLHLTKRRARFTHVRYPAGAFRRHRQQVTARPAEFSNEYARVFDRYSIDRRMRRLGPWLHAAYKVLDGAYARQIRAGRFRGTDLRWFDSRTARGAFDAFLAACYGAGSSREPRRQT